VLVVVYRAGGFGLHPVVYSAPGGSGSDYARNGGAVVASEMVYHLVVTALVTFALMLLLFNFGGKDMPK